MWVVVMVMSGVGWSVGDWRDEVKCVGKVVSHLLAWKGDGDMNSVMIVLVIVRLWC